MEYGHLWGRELEGMDEPAFQGGDTERDTSVPSQEEDMSVTLREITKDNWRHCIALDPGPASKAFIPSNPYPFAESNFSPSFVPLRAHVETVLFEFIMSHT